MLFGTSSKTSGAPGFTASAGVSTAGSGSMSSATASAASLACATRFRDHAGDRIADEAHLVAGSAGRGVLRIGEPSRFLNGRMHLSVP